MNEIEVLSKVYSEIKKICEEYEGIIIAFFFKALEVLKFPYNIMTSTDKR